MSAIFTKKIKNVRFHLLPGLPGRRCFSMQVTKIASGDVSYNDINKPTDEEMKNEYKYYLAEQMTKKLLEKGFISKV